ncbi:hypothetical protein KEM54_002444 [Ascosphaera aggregata]|nr:hypothetical protein KEM54_002444 [Ascosphaera aggregata]
MSSKGLRATGVLSGSSATNSTHRGSERGSGNSSAAKSSAPALKVVVRRLPPDLTQAEFENVLGEEWKVGGPWVDWYSYKPGKATKGIAKPSRPGRAYFHLTDQNKVSILHEKIKFSQFCDAANTHRDPVLAGPPYLQYAPFAKVPKRYRKDKRQGMIDQDPDFIAFLESLTNPIQKTSPGTWTEELKEEIPVVTPLIQYLKEKKAKQSKAKGSPSRMVRVQAWVPKDSKTDKSKKVSTRAGKEGDKRDKSTPASTQTSDKAKDKPSKELAKPAKGNRAPAVSESSVSKEKNTKDQKQKEKAPPTAPAADRKKDKGKIIVNPQILRREPSTEQPKETAKPPRGPKESRESREPREPREPKQSKEAKGKFDAGQDRSKTGKGSNALAATPTVPSGNVVLPTEFSSKPSKAPRSRREKLKEKAKSKVEEGAAAAPPSGPKAITTSESGAPANQQPPTKPAAATTIKAAAAAKQVQSTSQSQPAQPATQAFLKHANPSQGVTEENLFSGFSVFGEVLKTEIDKKKGFAYVYFADPEGLRKAIKASPVQIAQSKVVVAERKSAPQATVPRGRGGSGCRSSGVGGISAAQQNPPAQPQGQPQSQPHIQNHDRLPAQGQSQGQVHSQNNQPTKQPPTAPAAERAACSVTSNGNGKAPPTGPRSGRPRHHRGPRGGNRGTNKSNGNAGGSAPAAANGVFR